VDEESIAVALDGEWLPEGTQNSPWTEDMEILNGPMVKVLKIAAGKVSRSFLWQEVCEAYFLFLKKRSSKTQKH